MSKDLKSIAVVSLDAIEDCIHVVRGQKVILDNDLARLYKVTTFNLNKSVKRNASRFPKDFIFQLSKEEWFSLTFQGGISNRRGRGGRRSLPYVFTEQGVAILSGLLHSDVAVEVNIAIMRAFVRMRRLLSENRELAEQLKQLENKLIAHDYQIADIVKTIRKLMTGSRKSSARIGF